MAKSCQPGCPRSLALGDLGEHKPKSPTELTRVPHPRHVFVLRLGRDHTIADSQNWFVILSEQSESKDLRLLFSSSNKHDPRGAPPKLCYDGKTAPLAATNKKLKANG